jgi:hypothetical protein
MKFLAARYLKRINEIIVRKFVMET